MACKQCLKAFAALLSLGVIVGIYIALYRNTYDWSVKVAKDLKDSRGLQIWNTFMLIFGTKITASLPVVVFVAMFKRRHQAFSFLILWTFQIFLVNFFKLATHTAVPYLTDEEV